MAIRERKGRASPYQVYWNNPLTGKRECANFATREEALKHDSLVKHRLRFERESFLPEETGDDTRITLEQAYFLYLRDKKFNKIGLHWQLGAMKLPLKMYGSKPVASITFEDLRTVLAEHSQPGLKNATVRGRMSVLRTVMRWCAANGFCDTIPFPKLPPANYEKLVPPTPEEISRILAVCDDHIARVIIIGSQCGVRVGASELLRLTWKDMDFQRCLLRVSGARKNMEAQWREIPIRHALMPLFIAWHESDLTAGIAHIINYKGNPVKSIKTSWKNTLARAGITRRIRPYDLRHAFATELIAAGADIGTVAKLMGHSSPAMILNHYQYVMDSQKRAAVESLPIFHVPNTCAQTKKAATYKM